MYVIELTSFTVKPDQAQAMPDARKGWLDVVEWMDDTASGESGAKTANRPEIAAFFGTVDSVVSARLEQELRKGPLAHGFAGDQRWTLGRIKSLIGKLFHVGYTVEGIWKLMRRHGWSCRVPVRQAMERRATVDDQAWPLRSHLELAVLSGAVPRARHHARRVLADWGLGALGEPAELVVSELVTNAVRACQAAGAHRPVRLRLASDRARALIEVQDGSPQPPVSADSTADDENGRGLCLVEAMSAAWDWYPHRASGGKVVWALVPAAC